MEETTPVETFDDIRRCISVLTDDIAEEEFLRFLKLHDQFRQDSLHKEVQRIKKELDASLQNMADLESKLFHARRLLEVETKARREAEIERTNLEKRVVAMAEHLLQNEPNLNNETKDKLAFINTLPRKRKSLNPLIEDKFGNDINSTGSFLSDLSITQSEDDFLDVNHSKSWRKHRPSLPKNPVPCVGSKQSRLANNAAENGGTFFTPRTSRHSTSRRSTAQTCLNSDKPERIDTVTNYIERISATTKVTIPQDGGAIKAESTVQSIPMRSEYQQEKEVIVKEKRANVQNIDENIENVEPSKVSTPRSPFKQASAPPISLLSPAPEQKLLTNVLRQHKFVSRTTIRSEPCSHCQKKIRFGCISLRCRDCPVRIHTDCKPFLTTLCVPSSGTPTCKGLLGYIHEYAPDISPKIPALIVHCVTEIETRGLNEVGLYRVPGSEREVKALKERFLRGKTTPHLKNIDVHVLCGCIKDFLRSLREPLIPTASWKDFCNAVQNIEEHKIQSDLHKAIDALPDANRDTLAFLILHFQRIGECPVVRMSIENIAKVFGPTIVGNSSPDPDSHAIFTEVHIQCGVMLNLLKIPTEYWTKYVAFDYDKENLMQEMTETLKRTPGHKETFLSFYTSPMKNTVKKRKIIGLTPLSSARK